MNWNFFCAAKVRKDKSFTNGRKPPTLVDWKSLPYPFASSDATPLLLMATNDYMKISGDISFEQTHWGALAKAWNFETSHDTDGDGIYENIAGSGWVESWIPSMPHQEIYLAALDQQASTAFANLARATGHAQLAADAEKRAAHIAQQIEKEYYMSGADFYAFSHNADGSVDTSPTIYPAVAAWDGRLQFVPRISNAGSLGLPGILDRLGHAGPEPQRQFL